jgi:hypothetical protein
MDDRDPHSDVPDFGPQLSHLGLERDDPVGERGGQLAELGEQRSLRRRIGRSSRN